MIRLQRMRMTGTATPHATPKHFESTSGEMREVRSHCRTLMPAAPTAAFFASKGGWFRKSVAQLLKSGSRICKLVHRRRVAAASRGQQKLWAAALLLEPAN